MKEKSPRTEPRAFYIWSGWRDSNSQPLAPKASALPIAPHPDTFKFWGEWWGSNPRPPEPQPGALPTELHSPAAVFTYVRFLNVPSKA